MSIETFASLSRPVVVAEISAEPMAVSIEVVDADKAGLAKLYGAEDIRVLKGDLDVIRRGTLVRVAGLLEADLGRECVVSLEPMREVIAENFAVEYTTEPAEEPEGETEADLDAPEPIQGDTLDLGQVLVEQLVLAMDPHPRKEGAEPPEDPGRKPESSPFDVLKSLKSED
ncbi:MAG: DUF177 domain-containing protein [Pseudomonadota bacterium]